MLEMGLPRIFANGPNDPKTHYFLRLFRGPGPTREGGGEGDKIDIKGEKIVLSGGELGWVRGNEGGGHRFFAG